VFALANGPTPQDDSAWWKLDDEDFAQANGMGTVGWQWVKLGRRDLTAGEHTITITYREDGLMLDKVAVSSFAYGPEELPAEDVAAAGCNV